ncbi:MAG: DUF3488 and DUF4129 domain-containing transglutaminase family protein [Planctomycetota bacterium]
MTKQMIPPEQAIPREQAIPQATRLAFAVLAALGAVVLAIGSNGSFAAWLAFGVIVLGYLAVDLFQIFAMPRAAAYPMMAVVAAYCVSDFFDWDRPGNHQMVVVAQLLAFVQAILMLQFKTRRLLEQVATFALLQLVVAAVFNNALSFGILLVPMGIAAVYALSSLSVMHLGEASRPVQGDNMQMRFELAPGTLRRVNRMAPRMIMMTLAPAIALVAGVFFFALPRTTEAVPRADATSAVGFSDEVNLNAIRSTISDSSIALRVQFIESKTNKPYQTQGSVYFRGKVLDEYEVRFRGKETQAGWRSIPPPSGEVESQLPPLYIPAEGADRSGYDPVIARVTAESSRSKALFISLPAYKNESNRKTRYLRNRMSLVQRSGDALAYPRMIYDYITHAFYRGQQSRWTAMPERVVAEERPTWGTRKLMRQSEDYVRRLCTFDVDQMPAIEALAERFSETAAGTPRNAYELATALEIHLSTSPQYFYSLEPDMDVPAGGDPINHFVAQSKRGHCQYFASALALALRSQEIPSRLVIGYCTDEFNRVSGRQIARGTHAHVWVEALIPKEAVPAGVRLAGQPAASHYWYRLDPTPGVRQQAFADDGRGVDQVFDLAQNAWDDYVVEMDSDRQEGLILGAGVQNTIMHRSYVSLVRSAGQWLSNIRRQSGRGDGMTLGGFSGVAAAVTVFAALTGLAILRIRWSSLRRRRRQERDRRGELGKLAFFRRAGEALDAIGFHREATQTPNEWVDVVAKSWQHPLLPPASPSLAVLSGWYYRLRFGNDPALPTDRSSNADLNTLDSSPLAETISPDAQQEIDAALRSLEQACQRYAEVFAGARGNDAAGKGPRENTA